MRKRRGSFLIEFVLTVVPTIFLMITVFETSLVMWQYHTLAWTAQMSARYVVSHGASCLLNGCSAITIGNIATYIEQRATGLNPALLNATIIANASGTSTPCSPVSSCTSTATSFPSSANGDNAVGKNITITLTYPINNPIVMYWPGMSFMSDGGFTLGAISMQRIVF